MVTDQSSIKKRLKIYNNNVWLVLLMIVVNEKILTCHPRDVDNVSWAVFLFLLDLLKKSVCDA